MKAEANYLFQMMHELTYFMVKFCHWIGITG